MLLAADYHIIEEDEESYRLQWNQDGHRTRYLVDLRLASRKKVPFIISLVCNCPGSFFREVLYKSISRPFRR